MKREPILTRGFIVTLVTALISLGLAFGLPLTDEQQQAILGLTTVLAPGIVWLGTWAWARLYTTTLKDPRDNTGTELQRVDGLPPVSR